MLGPSILQAWTHSQPFMAFNRFDQENLIITCKVILKEKEQEKALLLG